MNQKEKQAIVFSATESIRELKSMYLKARDENEEFGDLLREESELTYQLSQEKAALVAELEALKKANGVLAAQLQDEADDRQFFSNHYIRVKGELVVLKQENEALKQENLRLDFELTQKSFQAMRDS